MADTDSVAADGPLADVVVVDLATTIAGSYCSKLLADYGAHVVKVEPPEGDPLRRVGPFPDASANPETSGTFLHLNTNKQSVVLDLAGDEGVAALRSLVRRADIVVETSRPGRMAELGLAPERLIADQPALVVTSVTPFGQSGPYAGYEMSEIVAMAMGGPMNASGADGGEPVKLVGNVVQMHSGATALVATLGAYYHAVERGQGQHVDVSTFETQNGNVDRRRFYLLAHAYSGFIGQRNGTIGAGAVVAGGRFEGADGKLISTGQIWPTHVRRMVAVLADAEMTDLWEKAGEAMVTDNVKEVNAAIARWAMGRPSRLAMREAQAAGWPVVVVNDPYTLLTDEHLVARGFWVSAPHPVAGELPYCGPPWRMEGGGWRLRRSAPTLGEDTTRILAGSAGDVQQVLHGSGR